jgi:pyruvate dehydrogenase (quinone)
METELNGIGCCMGCSGPRYIYLVYGFYANRAANPLIAIASAIHTDKMGRDNFQEIRPESLFQDCSKYIFMAGTPKQALNGLQIPIQHLIRQKGDAVLGLLGVGGISLFLQSSMFLQIPLPLLCIRQPNSNK